MLWIKETMQEESFPSATVQQLQLHEMQTRSKLKLTFRAISKSSSCKSLMYIFTPLCLLIHSQSQDNCIFSLVYLLSLLSIVSFIKYFSHHHHCWDVVKERWCGRLHSCSVHYELKMSDTGVTDCWLWSAGVTTDTPPWSLVRCLRMGGHCWDSQDDVKMSTLLCITCSSTISSSGAAVVISRIF